MTIYCDMDGVLVDFVNPTLELMNKCHPFNPEYWNARCEIGWSRDFNYGDIHNNYQNPESAMSNYVFSLIQDNFKFWAGLPWLNTGKDLWSFLSDFQKSTGLKVRLLTAPSRNDLWSGLGKEIWVRNNMPDHSERPMLEYNKYKYAMNPDGTRNILIDDMECNIEKWEQAGGIGILHNEQNWFETCLKLQELFLS